jgi:hypothetical protein
VNIGQLWTVANYPLHRHTNIDLKTCWRRFFQYRVFNWRPDLLLEHDWIQKCPLCNTRRGVEIEKSLVAPRLIYGETENYLLNAPLRYKCKDCEERYNLKLSHNVPKDQLKPFSFTTTNKAFLTQLAASEPGIFFLLPCVLTKRGGVCRHLVEKMKLASAKGHGPMAYSKTIRKLHCA